MLSFLYLAYCTFSDQIVIYNIMCLCIIEMLGLETTLKYNDYAFTIQYQYNTILNQKKSIRWVYFNVFSEKLLIFSKIRL